MKAAIVDYGAGNLRSAAKALQSVCPDGMDIITTGNPDEVLAADRIILPGVGAFRDCMNGLNSIDGMIAALEEVVLKKARPFLGICVGMQLMARRGLEHGEAKGLGWLNGDVIKIAGDNSLKVPHMGWNDVAISTPHPVLAGIKTGDHAYFVHSYWLQPDAGANFVVATTDYGQTITAAVARENMFGTQFHPEKSQETGLRLLHNFLRWRL